MSTLEEKLREASHLGDLEGVEMVLRQNVDVNAKNDVNGWTALHWACKRGHVNVVKTLLNNGANVEAQNNNGEKPINVASNPEIFALLGEKIPPNFSKGDNNLKEMADEQGKFVPNYLKNGPINGQVDMGPRLRSRHTDFSGLPTTALPSQADDLVLRVRIAGSNDPDFIEIEVPRWKLTYSSLLHICCEELEVKESQVERIRKLPNTRLRTDNDVKRLSYLQSLEVVLKAPLTGEKFCNVYQSISTKDQTILY